MLDRSRKGYQGPLDINQIAYRVYEQAISETPVEPTEDAKDPAAVSLGRRGGKVGGKARAAKLTAEQRSNIAKKAAAARWANRQGG